ncbi:hypothetical protein [Sphingomonas sp. TREG-RG-20F-R18-01]|uniref:hypothetical protein n=1 Tax=Sphingomonas sp. TREG-RG-20F-R18-01 TaxID=2914982 RepID=UPI001F58AB8E|nr:hypothetical protein [Sphingomonas sp. TREG-RG-20F-R18-01]
MKTVVLMVALAVATPAVARDLQVPADKGWQHAQTGLVLMSRLAGMRRTGLSDSTQGEQDVAAQFAAPDGSVQATLYLFHPDVADVSLWFDRSQLALRRRDIFRNATAATAQPIGFAAAGAHAATSLRQLFATPGSALSSTGLAIVPLGEWVVSIRISATTLNAAQLDTRLQQLIAEIRWPAADTQARIAAPMTACTTPLQFGKAKVAKPSGADLLMTLMMQSVAAKARADDKTPTPPSPPSLWCRAAEANADYGVYRSDSGAQGYVLALGDAGRVVSVYPSVMGMVDKTGTYTVSLQDVDGTVSAYPSFTALPTPSQVWALVGSGKRTGMAKGGAITIDPKAM